MLTVTDVFFYDDLPPRRTDSSHRACDECGRFAVVTSAGTVTIYHRHDCGHRPKGRFAGVQPVRARFERSDTDR